VVYLNSLEIGWTSTWLGFVVLAIFIPIWLYTQREVRSDAEKELRSGAAGSDDVVATQQVDRSTI
jgi:hypothetical protein